MDKEKNEGVVMNNKPEDAKKKKTVRIELHKPEDFKQVYSIGAVGGHSPYDFRIGFYNDMPMATDKSGEQVIQRRLETEVIMSPLAAVELVRWLNQHIQNYEAAFGPIAKPQMGVKKKPEPVQDSTEIQGYM
ncbi:MAG: hypothetical protein PWQ51_728 [Methanolobus sp.]|jgi:hypothetical protein|uniref:DUF3467 domain-containing protein n=1 Tax=unclassified Methanolobus TaxID=2629569 RepID=UPI0024AC334A|nr:DUF3467 domain-containing protein [Methanolobus sp.]MDI3486700.1 hypothetical protein [Methanolobus sp.]MDK2832768.1 hypothetical protein [Methanolobus sp.]MDK2938564.1 hypothetical protein [Methanolobus sp.]